MFLDEAVIGVKGGDGGNGVVGWRREKYVAKGGPDGGDGGRGGAIIFEANRNTDTLSDFASRKMFEADHGGNGSGSNKHGKNGEDLVLFVPPGTILFLRNEDGTDGEVIADLREDGDRAVAVSGGRGGFGNAHFVSSVRQRPDFAELGEPGETKTLTLELKLVADIGIIGYPSVGKSTLISVISNARPKIAAYPFTTLIPNLGVVQVHDRRFVVCDVPGLIEGASDGKGLGITFLRHIERTGALVHILDISRALQEGGEVSVEMLIADYQAIRHELERYSPTLAAKRELVVLNKSDLLAGDTKALEKSLKKKGITVFCSISAATRGNTDAFIEALLPIVLEEREKRQEEEVLADADAAKEIPVLRPQEETDKMGAYRIEKRSDGSLMVRGKRLEQFTKMTNFQNPGAVARFRDVVDRIGLMRGLRQNGLKEDSTVWIGTTEVSAYV